MTTVSSFDLPVPTPSSLINRTPETTAYLSIPKPETPLYLALLREQLLAGVRRSLPLPTKVVLPLVSPSCLQLYISRCMLVRTSLNPWTSRIHSRSSRTATSTSNRKLRRTPAGSHGFPRTNWSSTTTSPSSPRPRGVFHRPPLLLAGARPTGPPSPVSILSSVSRSFDRSMCAVKKTNRYPPTTTWT